MSTRLPLLLLLAGCIVGDDKYLRPRDLPSANDVVKLRVLAVVPEPPEARPGETVTFRALIADPEGVLEGTIWLACPPSDAGGYGCDVDLGALPEDPTPDDLAEAGVIGFQPGFDPVYEVPADLLDGLPAEDRLEGLSVTVQLAAFPAGAMSGEDTDFDYGTVEVAYKRLVISEAATPNRNPVVASFTVDGISVADGAVVEVDAGEAYDIGVILDAATVETYTYVNSDGIAEDRVEEPFTTWFCTGGALFNPYVLYPYTDVSWTAPDEPGAEHTCWGVVRDRRGGMTWHEQRLTIR